MLRLSEAEIISEKGTVLINKKKTNKPNFNRGYLFKSLLHKLRKLSNTILDAFMLRYLYFLTLPRQTIYINRIGAGD